MLKKLKKSKLNNTENDKKKPKNSFLVPEFSGDWSGGEAVYLEMDEKFYTKTTITRFETQQVSKNSRKESKVKKENI